MYQAKMRKNLIYSNDVHEVLYSIVKSMALGSGVPVLGWDQFGHKAKTH